MFRFFLAALASTCLVSTSAAQATAPFPFNLDADCTATFNNLYPQTPLCPGPGNTLPDVDCVMTARSVYKANVMGLARFHAEAACNAHADWAFADFSWLVANAAVVGKEQEISDLEADIQYLNNDIVVYQAEIASLSGLITTYTSQCNGGNPDACTQLARAEARKLVVEADLAAATAIRNGKQGQLANRQAELVTLKQTRAEAEADRAAALATLTAAEAARDSALAAAAADYRDDCLACCDN